MGMMFDGEWTDDDRRLIDSSGRFVRPGSSFRDRMRPGGRYHLFAAASCPWAHRAMIVRRLKGLEASVSMTLADLPRKRSWAFSRGIDALQPRDGVLELHLVYAAVDPRYTGRVTVPALWDRDACTIVNNESADIVRMFNDAGTAGPDLYPKALRAEIDEVNARVYEAVNNGVYRCGYAKSQSAYEAACRELFEALDWLEDRLGRQRYLVGDRLTEADVRLYTTLVRFDVVYYGHFKCNLRRLEEYTHLPAYVRDLWQTSGFGETTDLEDIKRHYYGEMPQVNPSRIVPLGPRIDFSSPHGRG